MSTNINVRCPRCGSGNVSPWDEALLWTGVETFSCDAGCEEPGEGHDGGPLVFTRREAELAEERDAAGGATSAGTVGDEWSPFVAGRAHAVAGGRLADCPYRGDAEQQWRDGFQDYMPLSEYEGLPPGMGPSPSEQLEMIDRQRREPRRVYRHVPKF